MICVSDDVGTRVLFLLGQQGSGPLAKQTSTAMTDTAARLFGLWQVVPVVRFCAVVYVRCC